MMGGGFLRGVAYLALAGVIAVSSCSAAFGAPGETPPAPAWAIPTATAR
jgi:hypothetical protein